MFFHPLDRAVHSLQAGIGEPVLKVGHDIWEATLNQFRHRDHRLQPAMETVVQEDAFSL